MMTRFSQRIGAKPPFKSGHGEVSGELRIATWNLLHPIIFPVGDSREWSRYQETAKVLWPHLNWATDMIPHDGVDGRRVVKDQWFRIDWSGFFDLFEASVHIVAQILRDRDNDRAVWFDRVNGVLEQQGCAYRFISEILAPITNPQEVGAIRLATECAIEAVSTHIIEALKQLPPNSKASTRNSIKESMLAVEATLKDVTNSPSATLGEGLKAFETKYGPLHESMRRGFEKLYAYSNGPDGIRHALVEGARDVTVDDARLMLIQCSAFSNYLIAIAEAANTKGAPT
jgi:AbiJ N-terminal domain 4